MADIFTQQPLHGIRLFEEVINSPNLALCLPLNEASGTIAYDRSENGLNGTITGGPTLGQTLTYLYGITFSSATKYITLGDLSALNFEKTDDFSIMAGVYITDVASNANYPILTKINSSGVGWAYYIEATTPKGFMRLASSTTTAVAVRGTTTTFTESRPYLVGMSYSGSGVASGVKLYTNGIAEALSTVDDDIGASMTNSATIRIASSEHADYTVFNGRIGFLAVWTGVVPAADFLKYAYVGGFK